MATKTLKFIRATDLQGGLWTIPTGSLLHRLLQEDQDRGNRAPVLSLDVIRNPQDKSQWQPKPALAEMLRLFKLNLCLPQVECAQMLFRMGEFARLRERVLG